MRSKLSTLKLASTARAIIIAEDDVIPALACQRLADLGVADIKRLTGDEAAWRDAGFAIVATPDQPSDSESFDLLHHVHQRNNPNGSEAGAKAYLAWEIGLVEQLDDQERASFRLTAA